MILERKEFCQFQVMGIERSIQVIFNIIHIMRTEEYQRFGKS